MVVTLDWLELSEMHLYSNTINFLMLEEPFGNFTDKLWQFQGHHLLVQ